jgi:hypothetical protein
MVAIAGATAFVLVAAALVAARATSRRASADVADASSQKRFEELRANAERLVEVEQRKRALEAQVADLERLRAGTTSKALIGLDAAARELGVEIRQLSLNDGQLALLLHGPSFAAVLKFARRAEEDGLVTGAQVEKRDVQIYAMHAALARPASPEGTPQ